MEDKEAEMFLEKAVNGLMEHFDAVQILVTWTDENDGGTFGKTWGAGNHYARIALMREYLKRDVAKINKLEIMGGG